MILSLLALSDRGEASLSGHQRASRRVGLTFLAAFLDPLLGSAGVAPRVGRKTCDHHDVLASECGVGNRCIRSGRTAESRSELLQAQPDHAIETGPGGGAVGWACITRHPCGSQIVSTNPEGAQDEVQADQAALAPRASASSARRRSWVHRKQAESLAEASSWA